jgi:hypothetical protein
MDHCLFVTLFVTAVTRYESCQLDMLLCPRTKCLAYV